MNRLGSRSDTLDAVNRKGDAAVVMGAGNDYARPVSVQ
jgi:hypothetical protein